MSNIYSLLNINPDGFQDFSLKATLVIDYQTERVVEKNVKLLKKIEVQTVGNKGIKVSLQSREEVIEKIKQYCLRHESSFNNWSIRELRIVSYYLMYLDNNTEAYIFALKLLDYNWKNIYFNGLVFCLMNYWNILEIEYRDSICRLVKKKLQQYDDKSQKYLNMKNHANLFENAGPIRMVTLLNAKSLNLFSAPTIIGFKDSTLNQSYYSDVIIKYIETNQINDLNYIQRIFDIHNLDRTKKLVFAFLVEFENNSNDFKRQISLCRFANRMLGDIALATSWTPFTGATYKESQRLKKTMQTINIWFSKKIIEAFFEVCVQDKDRKTFWLNYVSSVESFNIVGSTVIKQRLQSDSNIGSMFLPYFIETNSTTSQTSALILFIKDKMIVEFSDTGALYVYNQHNSMFKLVSNSKRTIASTNDLKIPSMQNLIEYGFYYEEGRMTHQGYWQSRLIGWMQTMVFSSNNTGRISAESNDESIFKANPLPKEFETKFAKSIEQEDSKNQQLLSDKLGEQCKDSVALDSTNQSAFNCLLESHDVQYKTDVFPLIWSKVFEDDLKIVADGIGFYVTNTLIEKYVLVKELDKDQYPKGSIWIKSRKMNGWNEIVHFYHNVQFSIGFIKKSKDILLFKESMTISDIKIIRLK